MDRYNRLKKIAEINGSVEHLIPKDGISKLRNKFPFFFTDEFLDHNSHILAMAGLEKYIGSGVAGVAFLTDKQTVFKIFDYISNFNDYKDIYNKQFLGRSNIYEPKIYAIGTFDTSFLKGDENIFLAYVEMEYLTSPGSISSDTYNLNIEIERLPRGLKYEKEINASINDMATIFQYILVYLSSAIEELINERTREMTQQEVNNLLDNKNAFNKFANRIYNIIMHYQYIMNNYLLTIISDALNIDSSWFKKLVFSLCFKILNSNLDLHADNLGLRNDTAVFFDF